MLVAIDTDDALLLENISLLENMLPLEYSVLVDDGELIKSIISSKYMHEFYKSM